MRVMSNVKSELTSGMLWEYRNKVVHNLLHNIDAKVHADSYTGCKGNDMYAEPEFTGKYIDLCMKLYRDTGDEKALQNAKIVVDSIVVNQREDGYLGCLLPGKETWNLSIWNEAFTIFGLVSYYEETGDKRALNAADKCVCYVMDYFVAGKADILNALNGGTQHISILPFICKLYKATKNEKYKKYILFIVDTIKNSDLNYFEFDSILELRTRKGIESFVILLGILEYADIFGDKDAIASVEKYWQQVADTQVRNTGNATLNEVWTEGGNGCMLLGEDVKPNETCVAVGWIELSLALFYLKQDAKYLDAIDKTLYNHMLASIQEDGSDFAYYQPNYGKKVRTKVPGLYQCCRYRGFTLFTYMNEMLYYENEHTIMPMLYTSGSYQSEDVAVVMETNYPFKGDIKLSALSNKDKELKLRIPNKCSVGKLVVNGYEKELPIIEGYVALHLEKDVAMDVELVLNNEWSIEYGQIESKEYVAFSYGCLLLAAYNVETDAVVNKNDLTFKQDRADDSVNLAFSISSISYCDYASADDYSVWLPLK